MPKKRIKYDELVKKIEKLIPGAQVEFDNDGQLIVYTGQAVDETDEEYLTNFKGE